MSATCVLDSWALIAYFLGDPAGRDVKELLEKAAHSDRYLHMTEVNYAEVKYIVIRKAGIQSWQEITRILLVLPVEFHPVTRELSDIAGDFKSKHSMSLADAFAAALAKEKKAELVTGDPEFKSVEKEVKIRWLAK